MTPQGWDISDFPDDDQNSPGRKTPILVSLHFIRNALRQRWLVCVLSPILGLLAAIAFLVGVGPPHKADASLVLAHDPQVDPSRAMETDVSLLRTRTVAAKTVTSLGLAMTPDDFQKTLTAVPVSSDLMTLTLSAPNDAEATRRLEALTSIYLTFRGEQLSLQSNVLVGGLQQRIAKLDGEVASLSKSIGDLSARGSSSGSKLSDAIAQRAYVQGQIETLQQSIQDATLQTTTVVSASRVIDPAAPERGGAKKRIVLILASGIIGGTAIGWGAVLFFAIISDRLRRRSDIADAVEAPVRVSVRRIAPIPERWLWVPHMRTINGSRTDDRHRLAHAVKMELPVPCEWGRLAVACIDNADEVRFAVATAAISLAAEGRSVALVDLTKQGSLDIQLMSSLAASTAQPTVLRPHGIPELAGAADLRSIVQEQEKIPELYDVVLVFADLDPSVGADHLTTWTDRVIFVATSGRSSAERLRTAADMVRIVGLDLRFVALLHTERTDESMGRSTIQTEQADMQSADHEEERLAKSQPAVDAADTNQLEAAGEQERDTEYVQTQIALAADGQVAVLEQYPDLLIASEDQPADIETTPDELQAAQEQQPTDIETTPDELQAAQEQQPTDIETTPDEQPTDIETTAQEQQPGAKVSWHAPKVEEQQAFDERVAAHEHPAVGESTDNELSARAQEEADAQLIDEEPGAVLREQPAEDEGGHTPETEQAAEGDQALKPPEEEVAVDGQHVDIAPDPLAYVSSASNSEDSDFDWSWEWSLDDPDSQLPEADGRHVHIAESPQTPVSSLPSSEADGLNWNRAWSFDDPGSNLEVLDSWPVYIDEYPQAYLGPALGTEDEEVDSDWDVHDSNQDSAVVATDEEADVSSDERPPTPAANGQGHRLVPEHQADEDAQNGAHLVGNAEIANGQPGNGPTGNSQISSDRERQRTKTRNRRRRSKLK